MAEVPPESLWLSYDKLIHFKLDVENKELVCKKNINGRIFTLNRPLPQTIEELSIVLTRLVNLPDEFWKPID